MKKFFYFALCASMLLLTACGGGKKTGSTPEPTPADDADKTEVIKPDTGKELEEPKPDLTMQYEPKFKIETSEGDIVVKLYEETPLHKDNFIKLAKKHFYDGILFHRIINGFMIQTGDPLTKDSTKVNAWGTGGPGYTILATRGFEERGVSGKINVTTSNSTTDKTAFIKMISGFGGGNAAITCGSKELRVKSEELKAFSIYDLLLQRQQILHSSLFTSHRVILTPTSATIDGKPVPCDSSLTSLYKHFVDDYPKYYKMDGLSRLGFIASELLIQAERKATNEYSTFNLQSSISNSSRAIVLFNSSSSVAADKKFLETIADDNFFPSPSVFVYTLPNIVTGEIAMRNGYHGETSFYVLTRRNEELMRQIILATLLDSELTSMITGWVDYFGENDYVADLMLIPSKV